MRKQDGLAVGMVHEVCVACGDKCNEQIILNRTLTRHMAAKVEEMDGKAIGFTMCEQCNSVVEQGGVLLVECDPTKSPPPNADGTSNPASVWRTGRVAGITGECFARIFNAPKPPKGVAFIEPELSEQLGLFRTEDHEEVDG